MKNIIGIMVCVNYAPILRITLPINTKKLKHIFVVTKKEDTETIRLCKKYKNVTVLFHDFMVGMDWIKDTAYSPPRKPPRFVDFRRKVQKNPVMADGSTFIERTLRGVNKKCFNFGGARRTGQMRAERQFPHDFYLVTDCDIVLTEEIASAIQDEGLEMDNFYHVAHRRDYLKRVDFENQRNWTRYGGPTIAGFFQLYKTSKPIYFKDHTKTTNVDMWFSREVIEYCGKKIKLNGHVDHLGTCCKGRAGKGYYDYEFIL